MISFFKKHKRWIYISGVISGTALLGIGIPMLIVGGYHNTVTFIDGHETFKPAGLLNYDPKSNSDTEFATFATGFRNAELREEYQRQIKQYQTIVDDSSNSENAKRDAKNNIRVNQSLLDIPVMYDTTIAGAIFISFGATGLIGGISFLIDLHKKNLFNKSTNKLS